MSSADHDRHQLLIRAAQDAVAPLHLVVDDVTVTPAGKRRVVRISVDDDLSALAPDDDTSPVGAVGLDAVAAATRAISQALDALDDTGVLGRAPYVLEVTSPGVSRPLTRPRHFRRNVGRLLEARLTEGAPVTGRIAAAGPGAVTLRVPGTTATGRPGTTGTGTTATGEHDRTLAYDEIARAEVQVEFARGEDRQED